MARTSNSVISVEQDEITQTPSDYRQLTDYIKKIHKIPSGDKVWGRLGKEIKTLMDTYNYTPIGILHTLKYCYEILGKPIIKEPGVGLVPFYYTKAMQYIQDKKDIDDLLSYIYKLFGITDEQKALYAPKLLYLINKYHQEQQCSFRGMKSTLYYYYYILQHNIPEEPDIKMIPIVYREAQQFKTQKDEVTKANSNCKLSPTFVYIPVDKQTKNDYEQQFEQRWRNPHNIIDITEIEVEEDEEFNCL